MGEPITPREGYGTATPSQEAVVEGQRRVAARHRAHEGKRLRLVRVAHQVSPPLVVVVVVIVVVVVVVVVIIALLLRRVGTTFVIIILCMLLTRSCAAFFWPLLPLFRSTLHAERRQIRVVMPH